MDRLSQLLTVGLRENWSVKQLADEIRHLYKLQEGRFTDLEFCDVCGRQLINGVCVKTPHSLLETSAFESK